MFYDVLSFGGKQKILPAVELAQLQAPEGGVIYDLLSASSVLGSTRGPGRGRPTLPPELQVQPPSRPSGLRGLPREFTTPHMLELSPSPLSYWLLWLSQREINDPLGELRPWFLEILWLQRWPPKLEGPWAAIPGLKLCSLALTLCLDPGRVGPVCAGSQPIALKEDFVRQLPSLPDLAVRAALHWFPSSGGAGGEDFSASWFQLPGDRAESHAWLLSQVTLSEVSFRDGLFRRDTHNGCCVWTCWQGWGFMEHDGGGTGLSVRKTI